MTTDMQLQREPALHASAVGVEVSDSQRQMVVQRLRHLAGFKGINSYLTLKAETALATHEVRYRTDA